MNRPNQEIMVLDWLMASHVTWLSSSLWLSTKFGRFLAHTSTDPSPRTVSLSHDHLIVFSQCCFHH